MTDPAADPTHAPDPLAVVDLAAACTAVDGVAPFSGHVLDALANATVHAVHRYGRLAGVAVLSGSDPAELAVHPDFRRQGIGGGLLDAVLTGAPGVWAHGALPAAAALADSRRLTVVRELLQMRRSLAGDLGAGELPAGISLRAFRPGVDDAAFLGVNARAFAWHPEQGRLDQAGLDAEKVQPWFDPAGFLLAVDSRNDADRVVGFHWTKVHATDPTPGDGDAAPGPIGEVYVLGVDPDAGIRGLGTPLSVAGLEYLRGRGLGTVMLYVEGDNVPALKLYERLGFQRYLTDLVYASR